MLYRIYYRPSPLYSQLCQRSSRFVMIFQIPQEEIRLFYRFAHYWVVMSFYANLK